MRGKPRPFFKKKKEELAKCPKCGKRQLTVKIKLRKNYPFGRKSKATYHVKKRQRRCLYCSYRDFTTNPPHFLG